MAACIFSVSATTLISSASRLKFAHNDVTFAAGRLRLVPTKNHCFKTRISCSVAKPETLIIVRSIFANHLSIDESKITAQTKLADLGADSLDTAEIVMHLEKEFEVTIEEGVENIITIQDAADIVEKHGHYGIFLLIEWVKSGCRLKGGRPPSS